MTLQQILGLPVPQYFLLRAVVKGVKLYLDEDDHLEVGGDLDANDQVVQSLLRGGFLELREKHYLATDKGRSLISSMRFAAPKMRCI